MEGWNTIHMPKPYKMVKILLYDGRETIDMAVKGKYGNIEWRNYVDGAVIGWKLLESSK